MQLPCSPALAFLYLWPLPPSFPSHPPLVRIARNSAVPQKWCKCTTYLHLTRHCTVGRSWLRWRHSSARLRHSTTQHSVADRAPRRCLPACVLAESAKLARPWRICCHFMVSTHHLCATLCACMQPRTQGSTTPGHRLSTTSTRALPPRRGWSRSQLAHRPRQVHHCSVLRRVLKTAASAVLFMQGALVSLPRNEADQIGLQ